MERESQQPPEKKRDRKEFWVRILIFFGGIIAGAIAALQLLF